MSEQERVPPGIDVSKMSHARAYDYVLGGKDNYAVDRAAAEQVMRLAPDLPVLGRAQRRFLLRVTRMCAEAGVDQFLDVGTGIPTAPNVHETAKAINPDARVVYVDYDPIVSVHNNALLATDPTVVSIQADVRDPEGIMDHPEVAPLLDYGKPILVLFVGLFHLVGDDDDPAGLVARFRERMVPGSHVMISQFCADGSDPAARAKLEEISVNSPSPMRFRTKAEIGRFFGGFEMLEPGLVDVQDWWPDDPAPMTKLKVAAGVGKVV
ncbi:SAM-dependent methyltransferase [Spongiactinospora sp. TRM90649]|uniref:SAM-dependent methyltransferase n=1 Tax=Spongiactinospora sp. TRM90649 TaxID=3031114 RepID=UPI0023F6E1CE|nr:SAM-dependent methyltransferase [Spongiactinospora sp. TRM90649]MDF5751416.1 SAM-dependent methyltransferase [Spongiactinospora sp. TRM90649]